MSWGINRWGTFRDFKLYWIISFLASAVTECALISSFASLVVFL